MTAPQSSDDEAEAAKPRAPVLVLGLGNILLGDEGVGVRVVERLQADPRLPEGVDVIDGGTAGMALIDVIAGRRHVVIVDAVKSGSPPATLVTLEDDAIPVGFRERTTPHALGLGDVLAVLRLQGEAPARLTLIGVEPDSLDFGLELSPAIEARVAEMAERALAALARD